MSTIRHSMNFESSVVETPSATEAPAAASPEIVHNQFNRSVGPLSAATVPPAAVVANLTLTGASGTINLAALPTLLGTIDCTGKKLRSILIVNENASNTFGLQVGASNGYSLGSAVFKVGPGGRAMQYFADALAAVAAGTRTLDWTGTALQTFSVQLVLG